MMIIVNFFLFFTNIPLWLKHALPYHGITIIDLGGPLFLFVLGIFYALSFEKRMARDGARKTVQHFVIRYLTLWLFGFVGILVTTYQLTFGWNVLMAIGLSGLYALPFMFLKPIWRLIVGIALLVFYQLVILQFFSNVVLSYDMGGFLGGISWAALVLMASFWWHHVKKDNHNQLTSLGLGFGIVSLAVGFGLAQFFPASKPLVSSSYIPIAYGAAVLGLLVFHWLGEIKKVPWKIFEIMGKNALLLYMVSSVINMIVQSWVGAALAGPLVVFDGLLIYGVCLAVAYWLDYRKLYIKL